MKARPKLHARSEQSADMKLAKHSHWDALLQLPWPEHAFGQLASAAIGRDSSRVQPSALNFMLLLIISTNCKTTVKQDKRSATNSQHETAVLGRVQNKTRCSRRPSNKRARKKTKPAALCGAQEWRVRPLRESSRPASTKRVRPLMESSRPASTKVDEPLLAADTARRASNWKSVTVRAVAECVCVVRPETTRRVGSRSSKFQRNTTLQPPTHTPTRYR